MSGAEGGQIVSTSSAQGDSDSEPERPNPVVEEQDGKQECKILYYYSYEPEDKITWDIEEQEGCQVITFSVKRRTKVVCELSSRPIPKKENAQLVEKKKGLNVKKGYFEVKLKKRKDFSLTPFFRGKSP